MSAGGPPSRGPSPGWGVLACAWCASVLVVAAPLTGDARSLSRLALAMLPFVALAGLPLPRARVAAEPGDGAPRGGASFGAATLWCAAALGPFAVAARLDAEQGRAALDLARAFGVGLVATFSLAYAAHTARGARLHAVLWALLVLAPALAGGVAALFASPTDAELLRPGWSPLGWTWLAVRDLERGVAMGAVVAPLGIVVALLVAARSTPEEVA